MPLYHDQVASHLHLHYCEQTSKTDGYENRYLDSHGHEGLYTVRAAVNRLPSPHIGVLATSCGDHASRGLMSFMAEGVGSGIGKEAVSLVFVKKCT